MADLYDIKRLLELAAISERTLRHWIREKLVPKPIGRGRAARYTADHLNRVRIIQHLRSTKLSLRKIRSVLSSRPEQELLAAIPKTAPRLPDALPPPLPEPAYPHRLWQVLEVVPGLVVMVRADAGVMVRRIAQDIYEHYQLPAGYGVQSM